MIEKQSSLYTIKDPPVIEINQNPKGGNYVYTLYTKTATPSVIKDEGKTNRIGLDRSESTLSVVDINEKHSPYCALEVSVLEKHVEGCAYKKFKQDGSYSSKDKVGSYDVVGRLVYRTCTKRTSDSLLKNSAKGFKLNDPECFGKELKEERSKVEIIPILPNLNSCILHMNGAISGTSKDQEKDYDTPTVFYKKENLSDQSLDENITLTDSLDVLSVYIRADKTEKAPPGFQKMHYRTSSCKLHCSDERNKQILELQKVIYATSSGAKVAKSTKMFNQREVSHTVTEPSNSPRLPQMLFTRTNVIESKSSINNLHDTLDSDVDNNINTIILLQNRKSSSTRAAQNNFSGLLKFFKRNKPKKLSADIYSCDSKNGGRKKN